MGLPLLSVGRKQPLQHSVCFVAFEKFHEEPPACRVLFVSGIYCGGRCGKLALKLVDSLCLTLRKVQPDNGERSRATVAFHVPLKSFYRAGQLYRGRSRARWRNAAVQCGAMHSIFEQLDVGCGCALQFGPTSDYPGLVAALASGVARRASASMVFVLEDVFGRLIVEAHSSSPSSFMSVEPATAASQGAPDLLGKNGLC